MNDLIRVANVKTLQVAPNEKAFYIGRGRAPAGCEQAGLGNPFKVGPHYQQGEAAAAYLPYLREKCRAKSEEYFAVQRIAALLANGQRIVLVCWCAPKPCHGDAVRTAVLAYAKQLTA